MDKKSKRLNCQCHALSLCLQNSCEKTFGVQGIGHCNIFQAVYVYVKTLKILHEDGGAEIVDAVHTLVVDNLTTSCDWQEEASKSNEIAFNDVWNRLMAEPEDNVYDAVVELSTMHAKDIKMPNFARWMAIFPALELFIDNWTIVYFIALAIKQSRPSSSSLHKYSCTLLGLMNLGSGPAGTQVRRGQTPPLYAEGLFVIAFGKAYFVKHFQWLLRNDPEFGRDSYGQSV